MPITANQLLPGDILLKYSDGSASNNAIVLGQKKSDYAEIVHAAVVFEQPFIIESVGSGIVHISLLHDSRADNSYDVFRCRDRTLAAKVKVCAKTLSDAGSKLQTLDYSKKGAILSAISPKKAMPSQADVDARVQKILQKKKDSTFCSAFVILVYQWAAYEIGINPEGYFPYDGDTIPPATLKHLLIKSSKFDGLGRINAPA